MLTLGRCQLIDIFGGCLLTCFDVLWHVHSLDFPARVCCSDEKTKKQSWVIYFRFDSLLYCVCKTLSGSHLDRKKNQACAVFVVVFIGVIVSV